MANDLQELQELEELEHLESLEKATPSQNMAKPGLLAGIVDKVTGGGYSKLNASMGQHDQETHDSLEAFKAAHPDPTAHRMPYDLISGGPTAPSLMGLFKGVKSVVPSIEGAVSAIKSNPKVVEAAMGVASPRAKHMYDLAQAVKGAITPAAEVAAPEAEAASALSRALSPEALANKVTNSKWTFPIKRSGGGIE